jgi:hypothetical protein
MLSKKRAAEASMERASDISDNLTGVGDNSKGCGEETFSVVRLRLALEERGTGCPKKTESDKKV